ncbi:MAG: metalloregulator ArsR/SmtB family transcription factor [Salinibacterium sp.]|nr:metalloregulator ArsR/SmtB family transcription factor [Salinibacterium sp.]
MQRDVAESIASNLRVLADATRVQLLSLIIESTDARSSVTDLAVTLGLSQPTVSHHLKVLADEGIVERARDGRLAWYSITARRMTEVMDVMRDDPVVAAVVPPVLERITTDLSQRFRGTFSQATVRRYVRESYALLAERASITRYLPSLTARFASDRLDSIARIDSGSSAPTVLFVCVQNSGRSQLAAGILRSLAGDRVRVLTAGSQPASAINPRVVAALDEIGVPLDGEFPKPLTDEVVRGADVIVTMGCGDACPVYPGRRYLDWELNDPAVLSMVGVRAIRDDVDKRVRQLLTELEL